MDSLTMKLAILCLSWLLLQLGSTRALVFGQEPKYTATYFTETRDAHFIELESKAIYLLTQIYSDERIGAFRLSDGNKIAFEELLRSKFASWYELKPYRAYRIDRKSISRSCLDKIEEVLVKEKDFVSVGIGSKVLVKNRLDDKPVSSRIGMVNFRSVELIFDCKSDLSPPCDLLLPLVPFAKGIVQVASDTREPSKWTGLIYGDCDDGTNGTTMIPGAEILSLLRDVPIASQDLAQSDPHFSQENFRSHVCCITNLNLTRGSPPLGRDCIDCDPTTQCINAVLLKRLNSVYLVIPSKYSGSVDAKSILRLAKETNDLSIELDKLAAHKTDDLGWVESGRGFSFMEVPDAAFETFKLTSYVLSCDNLEPKPRESDSFAIGIPNVFLHEDNFQPAAFFLPPMNRHGLILGPGFELCPVYENGESLASRQISGIMVTTADGLESSPCECLEYNDVSAVNFLSLKAIADCLGE